MSADCIDDSIFDHPAMLRALRVHRNMTKKWRAVVDAGGEREALRRTSRLKNRAWQIVQSVQERIGDSQIGGAK